MVDVPGFRLFNTSSNPRSVNPLDLTENLNTVWDGNSVVTRYGSSQWKNTAQSNWGRIAKAKTFHKLGDTFYYVVTIHTTGRVFYIRSDDANFGTAAATWTELNSPASATPALAVSANRYDLHGFNNRLYLSDSTNGYFSWNGTDADLTTETAPPNLSTNNIVALSDKTDRLSALDDGGSEHLSAINDGQDFTALSGGGRLRYGRVEGLQATNIVPFGDDQIITTEDKTTLQFQAYRLSGIQFFDPATAGTDTSQFEVRKVSSAASIIGDSAQEVTGDTIGLTTRGFVALSSVLSKNDVTERDFISFPIKELITQINFEAVDKISSAVDKDGRYYCAVPYGGDATEANVVFVYDFFRSSPQENIYRWSLWAFQGFQDIGTMFTIKGQLYITDTDGNIYKFNDTDASYQDSDSSGNAVNINSTVRTAAIGGDKTGTEKYFGRLAVVIKDLPSDRFQMTLRKVVNGVVISEDLLGDPLPTIPIEPTLDGLRYETAGVNYDDFNYYDSGSDQRVVTFDNVGGNAQAMQWQFSTDTTGVSWGIGGFSVEMEESGRLAKAGVNDSGDI